MDEKAKTFLGYYKQTFNETKSCELSKITLPELLEYKKCKEFQRVLQLIAKEKHDELVAKIISDPQTTSDKKLALEILEDRMENLGGLVKKKIKKDQKSDKSKAKLIDNLNPENKT